MPALRLAVGTLTIMPTGAVTVTPKVAGRAMMLAPAAVLPLAVLASAAAWAAGRLGLPPLLVGVVGVAVLAWGTRALHLDGLADTADGLGSGWDRAKALAVMRRGDVGPFGVVTLVLVLLAQATAIGTLGAERLDGALLLAALVVVSRCAVPTACVRVWRAARPDGLGAAVAGTVPPMAAVLLWLSGVVLLLASSSAGFGIASILSATVTVGAAAVAVVLMVRSCVRRFGGITGDVIGAAVEVGFTVLLVMTVVAR